MFRGPKGSSTEKNIRKAIPKYSSVARCPEVPRVSRIFRVLRRHHTIFDRVTRSRCTHNHATTSISTLSRVR
eukprot:883946-Pyramimonas_sp.AAC.1